MILCMVWGRNPIFFHLSITILIPSIEESLLPLIIFHVSGCHVSMDWFLSYLIRHFVFFSMPCQYRIISITTAVSKTWYLLTLFLSGIFWLFLALYSSINFSINLSSSSNNLFGFWLELHWIYGSIGGKTVIFIILSFHIYGHSIYFSILFRSSLRSFKNIAHIFHKWPGHLLLLDFF